MTDRQVGRGREGDGEKRNEKKYWREGEVKGKGEAKERGKRGARGIGRKEAGRRKIR